jgi:hypothetical protein
MMSAEMRMPFNLPVGDLSGYWPDASGATDVEKQA